MRGATARVNGFVFVYAYAVGNGEGGATKRCLAVIPVIAQLAEHLTVDSCSYQMVPGSIPGDRIWQIHWAWKLSCERGGRTHGHFLSAGSDLETFGGKPTRNVQSKSPNAYMPNTFCKLWG